MEQRGTASAGKCRLANVGVVGCIDNDAANCLIMVSDCVPLCLLHPCFHHVVFIKALVYMLLMISSGDYPSGMLVAHNLQLVDDE
jgi:hypothetical protein